MKLKYLFILLIISLFLIGCWNNQSNNKEPNVIDPPQGENQEEPPKNENQEGLPEGEKQQDPPQEENQDNPKEGENEDDPNQGVATENDLSKEMTESDWNEALLALNSNATYEMKMIYEDWYEIIFIEIDGDKMHYLYKDDEDYLYLEFFALIDGDSATLYKNNISAYIKITQIEFDKNEYTQMSFDEVCKVTTYDEEKGAYIAKVDDINYEIIVDKDKKIVSIIAEAADDDGETIITIKNIGSTKLTLPTKFIEFGINASTAAYIQETIENEDMDDNLYYMDIYDALGEASSCINFPFNYDAYLWEDDIGQLLITFQDGKAREAQYAVKENTTN